jgi:hypothetical protein
MIGGHCLPGGAASARHGTSVMTKGHFSSSSWFMACTACQHEIIYGDKPAVMRLGMTATQAMTIRAI